MTTYAYKIGDRVRWTNSYGVDLGIRLVVGCEMWESGPRYFIEPHDAPWYPVCEGELTLESGGTP